MVVGGGRYEYRLRGHVLVHKDFIIDNNFVSLLALVTVGAQGGTIICGWCLLGTTDA